MAGFFSYQVGGEENAVGFFSYLVGGEENAVGFFSYLVGKLADEEGGSEKGAVMPQKHGWMPYEIKKVRRRDSVRIGTIRT